MLQLSPGVFKAKDGETVSIDVRPTGTLPLVTAALGGATLPVTAGAPIRIKLDKSIAPGGSFVPNARSIDLTLGFTFSGSSGGRYDLTLTGDAGGSFPDFMDQGGSTLEATTYTFHII